MQRIAEILVENYISHNITPQISTRSSVLLKIKKIVVGLVQFIGITVSLVSANLLTSVFQPVNIPPAMTDIYIGNVSTYKPSQMCNWDYGCDRNVCWRTCDVGSSVHGKNNSQAFCYTTPRSDGHNFQQCIYPHDCSPCWECLGPCHLP